MFFNNNNPNNNNNQNSNTLNTSQDRIRSSSSANSPAINASNPPNSNGNGNFLPQIHNPHVPNPQPAATLSPQSAAVTQQPANSNNSTRRRPSSSQRPSPLVIATAPSPSPSLQPAAGRPMHGTTSMIIQQPAGILQQPRVIPQTTLLGSVSTASASLAPILASPLKAPTTIQQVGSQNISWFWTNNLSSVGNKAEILLNQIDDLMLSFHEDFIHIHDLLKLPFFTKDIYLANTVFEETYMFSEFEKRYLEHATKKLSKNPTTTKSNTNSLNNSGNVESLTNNGESISVSESTPTEIMSANIGNTYSAFDFGSESDVADFGDFIEKKSSNASNPSPLSSAISDLYSAVAKERDYFTFLQSYHVLLYKRIQVLDRIMEFQEFREIILRNIKQNIERLPLFPTEEYLQSLTITAQNPLSGSSAILPSIAPNSVPNVTQNQNSNDPNVNNPITFPQQQLQQQILQVQQTAVDDQNQLLIQANNLINEKNPLFGLFGGNFSFATSTSSGGVFSQHQNIQQSLVSQQQSSQLAVPGAGTSQTLVPIYENPSNMNVNLNELFELFYSSKIPKEETYNVLKNLQKALQKTDVRKGLFAKFKKTRSEAVFAVLKQYCANSPLTLVTVNNLDKEKIWMKTERYLLDYIFSFENSRKKRCKNLSSLFVISLAGGSLVDMLLLLHSILQFSTRSISNGVLLTNETTEENGITLRPELAPILAKFASFCQETAKFQQNLASNSSVSALGGANKMNFINESGGNTDNSKKPAPATNNPNGPPNNKNQFENPKFKGNLKRKTNLNIKRKRDEFFDAEKWSGYHEFVCPNANTLKKPLSVRNLFLFFLSHIDVMNVSFKKTRLRPIINQEFLIEIIPETFLLLISLLKKVLRGKDGIVIPVIAPPPTESSTNPAMPTNTVQQTPPQAPPIQLSAPIQKSTVPNMPVGISGTQLINQGKNCRLYSAKVILNLIKNNIEVLVANRNRNEKIETLTKRMIDSKPFFDIEDIIIDLEEENMAQSPQNDSATSPHSNTLNPNISIFSTSRNSHEFQSQRQFGSRIAQQRKMNFVVELKYFLINLIYCASPFISSGNSSVPSSTNNNKDPNYFDFDKLFDRMWPNAGSSSTADASPNKPSSNKPKLSSMNEEDRKTEDNQNAKNVKQKQKQKSLKKDIPFKKQEKSKKSNQNPEIDDPFNQFEDSDDENVSDEEASEDSSASGAFQPQNQDIENEERKSVQNRNNEEENFESDENSAKQQEFLKLKNNPKNPPKIPETDQNQYLNNNNESQGFANDPLTQNYDRNFLLDERDKKHIYCDCLDILASGFTLFYPNHDDQINFILNALTTVVKRVRNASCYKKQLTNPTALTKEELQQAASFAALLDNKKQLHDEEIQKQILEKVLELLVEDTFLFESFISGFFAIPKAEKHSPSTVGSPNSTPTPTIGKQTNFAAFLANKKEHKKMSQFFQILIENLRELSLLDLKRNKANEWCGTIQKEVSNLILNWQNFLFRELAPTPNLSIKKSTVPTNLNSVFGEILFEHTTILCENALELLVESGKQMSRLSCSNPSFDKKQELLYALQNSIVGRLAFPLLICYSKLLWRTENTKSEQKIIAHLSSPLNPFFFSKASEKHSFSSTFTQTVNYLVVKMMGSIDKTLSLSLEGTSVHHPQNSGQNFNMETNTGNNKLMNERESKYQQPQKEKEKERDREKEKESFQKQQKTHISLTPNPSSSPPLLQQQPKPSHPNDTTPPTPAKTTEIVSPTTTTTISSQAPQKTQEKEIDKSATNILVQSGNNVQGHNINNDENEEDFEYSEENGIENEEGDENDENESNNEQQIQGEDEMEEVNPDQEGDDVLTNPEPIQNNIENYLVNNPENENENLGSIVNKGNYMNDEEGPAPFDEEYQNEDLMNNNYSYIQNEADQKPNQNLNEISSSSLNSQPQGTVILPTTSAGVSSSSNPNSPISPRLPNPQTLVSRKRSPASQRNLVEKTNSMVPQDGIETQTQNPKNLVASGAQNMEATILASILTNKTPTKVPNTSNAILTTPTSLVTKSQGAQVQQSAAFNENSSGNSSSATTPSPPPSPMSSNAVRSLRRMKPQTQGFNQQTAQSQPQQQQQPSPQQQQPTPNTVQRSNLAPTNNPENSSRATLQDNTGGCDDDIPVSKLFDVKSTQNPQILKKIQERDWFDWRVAETDHPYELDFSEKKEIKFLRSASQSQQPQTNLNHARIWEDEIGFVAIKFDPKSRTTNQHHNLNISNTSQATLNEAGKTQSEKSLSESLQFSGKGSTIPSNPIVTRGDSVALNFSADNTGDPEWGFRCAVFPVLLHENRWIYEFLKLIGWIGGRLSTFTLSCFPYLSDYEDAFKDWLSADLFNNGFELKPISHHKQFIYDVINNTANGKILNDFMNDIILKNEPGMGSGSNQKIIEVERGLIAAGLKHCNLIDVALEFVNLIKKRRNESKYVSEDDASTFETGSGSENKISAADQILQQEAPTQVTAIYKQMRRNRITMIQSKQQMQNNGSNSSGYEEIRNAYFDKINFILKLECVGGRKICNEILKQTKNITFETTSDGSPAPSAVSKLSNINENLASDKNASIIEHSANRKESPGSDSPVIRPSPQSKAQQPQQSLQKTAQTTINLNLGLAGTQLSQQSSNSNSPSDFNYGISGIGGISSMASANADGIGEMMGNDDSSSGNPATFIPMQNYGTDDERILMQSLSADSNANLDPYKRLQNVILIWKMYRNWNSMDRNFSAASSDNYDDLTPQQQRNEISKICSQILSFCQRFDVANINNLKHILEIRKNRGLARNKGFRMYNDLLNNISLPSVKAEVISGGKQLLSSKSMHRMANNPMGEATAAVPSCDFHFFNNLEGCTPVVLQKLNSSFKEFVTLLISELNFGSSNSSNSARGLVLSGYLRVILDTLLFNFKKSDIKWILETNFLKKLQPIMYSAQIRYNNYIKQQEGIPNPDANNSASNLYFLVDQTNNTTNIDPISRFSVRDSETVEYEAVTKQSWKNFRMLAIRCIEMLEEHKSNKLVNQLREDIFALLFDELETLIAQNLQPDNNSGFVSPAQNSAAALLKSQQTSQVVDVLVEMLSLMVSLCSTESAQVALSSVRFQGLLLPLLKLGNTQVQELSLQLCSQLILKGNPSSLMNTNSNSVENSANENLDEISENGSDILCVIFEFLGSYVLHQVTGLPIKTDFKSILNLGLQQNPNPSTQNTSSNETNSPPVISMDMARQVFTLIRKLFFLPQWKRELDSMMKNALNYLSYLVAENSKAPASPFDLFTLNVQSLKNLFATLTILIGFDHIPTKGQKVSANFNGRWENNVKIVSLEEHRLIARVEIPKKEILGSNVETSNLIERVPSESIRVFENDVLDPSFVTKETIEICVNFMIKAGGTEIFSHNLNQSQPSIPPLGPAATNLAANSALPSPSPAGQATSPPNPFQALQQLIIHSIWMKTSQVVNLFSEISPDLILSSVLSPSVMQTISKFATRSCKTYNEVKFGKTPLLNRCTYAHTGKKFARQYYYVCQTCCNNPATQNQSKPVCAFCARTCHRGHRLGPPELGDFFCDCGAGESRIKCNAIGKVAPKDPDLTLERMEALLLRIQRLMPLYIDNQFSSNISNSQQGQSEGMTRIASSGNLLQQNSQQSNLLNSSNLGTSAHRPNLTISTTGLAANSTFAPSSPSALSSVITPQQQLLLQQKLKRPSYYDYSTKTLSQNDKIKYLSKFFDKDPNLVKDLVVANPLLDLNGLASLIFKMQEKIPTQPNPIITPPLPTNSGPNSVGAGSGVASKNHVEREKLIVQMEQMGFERPFCIQALKLAGGEINSALNLLFDGNVTLPDTAPPQSFMSSSVESATVAGSMLAAELADDPNADGLGNEEMLSNEGNANGEANGGSDGPQGEGIANNTNPDSKNYGTALLGSSFPKDELKDLILKGMLQNPDCPVNENSFFDVSLKKLSKLEFVVISPEQSSVKQQQQSIAVGGPQANGGPTLSGSLNTSSSSALAGGNSPLTAPPSADGINNAGNSSISRMKGTIGVVLKKTQNGVLVQSYDPFTNSKPQIFLSQANVFSPPYEFRNMQISEIGEEAIKYYKSIGVMNCRRIVQTFATYHANQQQKEREKTKDRNQVISNLTNAKKIVAANSFGSNPKKAYNLLKALFVRQYQTQMHRFVESSPKVDQELEKLFIGTLRKLLVSTNGDSNSENPQSSSSTEICTLFDLVAEEASKEIERCAIAEPYMRKVVGNAPQYQYNFNQPPASSSTTAPNTNKIPIKFWGATSLVFHFPSNKAQLQSDDCITFYADKAGKKKLRQFKGPLHLPKWFTVLGGEVWIELKLLSASQQYSQQPNSDYTFFVTPGTYQLCEHFAINQPNIALASLILQNLSPDLWAKKAKQSNNKGLELIYSTFNYGMKYLLTPFAAFKGSVGGALSPLILTIGTLSREQQKGVDITSLKKFRIELELLKEAFRVHHAQQPVPLPFFHDLVEFFSIARQTLVSDLCVNVYPLYSRKHHFYQMQTDEKSQPTKACTCCVSQVCGKDMFSAPKYIGQLQSKCRISHVVPPSNSNLVPSNHPPSLSEDLKFLSPEDCPVCPTDTSAIKGVGEIRNESNLIPIENLPISPADWFEHATWIDKLAIVHELLECFVYGKKFPSWFLFEAFLETKKKVFYRESPHPYKVINDFGSIHIPGAKTLFVSFDKHSKTHKCDRLVFSTKKVGGDDLGSYGGDELRDKTIVVHSSKVNFQFRAVGGDHEVKCSHCGQPIHGVRHHCTQCDEFDLCTSCIQLPNIHPDTHLFLKIRRPVDCVPAALNNLYSGRWVTTSTFRGCLHHGFKCDACGQEPIIGIRYWCENCDNYNLCEKCAEEEYTHHDRMHTFLRVKRPLPPNKSQLNHNALPYGLLYEKDIDTHWGYLFSVSSVDTNVKYDDPAIHKVMKSIEEEMGSWNEKMDQQLVSYVESFSNGWQSLEWNTLHPTKEQLLHYPKLTNTQLLKSNSLKYRFIILKLLNRKISRILHLLDLGRGHEDIIFRDISSFDASEISSIPLIEQKTASLSNLIMSIRERMFNSVKMDVFNHTLTKALIDNIKPVTLQLNRHKSSEEHATLELRTHNSLFIQAFSQVNAFLPKVFRRKGGPWKVKLIGEQADDYGGPFRETLTQMCLELQNLDIMNMFIHVPNYEHKVGENHEKWIPNPSSTSDRCLKWYRFVGILMGIGLLTKNLLPLDFPSIVWKGIVKQRVTGKDLRRIDKLCLKTLSDLRDIESRGITPQNFNSIFFETFAIKGSDGSDVELIKNGANKEVNFDNRLEYLKLVEEFRLHKEIAPQIEAIRDGFYYVFDSRFLPVFCWNELEKIVCGSPDIDINLLKKHTIYEGYNSNSKEIRNFWAILESFDADERSLYLRFVWGRSRLPNSEDGFTNPMKIQKLDKGPQTDQTLPLSHTCFFSIELPPYSTKDIMRQKLLYAITNCKAIDTDLIYDQ